MTYVLLNPDGSVKRYPYTLFGLRRDNPETSFPKNISPQTAAAFDVYPVQSVDQPTYDHTVTLSEVPVKQGDQWVQQWIAIPESEEVIQARTDAKAQEVRELRDQLLRASDWVVIQEQELAAREPRSVAHNKPINDYRQALRDITNQPGFPHSVTWPDKP